MNFLQLLRRRRGKSQQEMAEQLGMTRQTYARRESNPENLTIGEAIQVSGVLDVDVAHLVTGVARTYGQEHEE